MPGLGKARQVKARLGLGWAGLGWAGAGGVVRNNARHDLARVC